MRDFLRSAGHLFRRIWCVVRHPHATFEYIPYLGEWVCMSCGARHGR